MATPEKWSGKSRGGGFGYSFFIFLVRKMGLGFAYGFLALVVVYFVPFAPVATASVWFYNRRILGYGKFKAFIGLFTHYYRFGQTIVDKIALAAGMYECFRFEFDNYDRFIGILDSGKGVVVIGAHVGSWEAGAHLFGDYADKMNIVMFDAEYEKIKRAFKDGVGETKLKVIAVNDDGLESVLKIKNALDNGEYVCFQGDRYVSESATVEAEFLGRKARFPQGPFLIASRMKVPVVFYYAMRAKGRKYRFGFVEATAQSEKGLLDEYLAATEHIVRSYPEQWFNFYKFWI